MLHRCCLRMGAVSPGILALAFPSSSAADSSAGLHAPVAAIGRVPLAMHGYFVLIVAVLFVVVFAVMIYSLAKHRKSAGDQSGRFTGPTGTVQWLWAMVPFAILLFVVYALISQYCSS